MKPTYSGLCLYFILFLLINTTSIAQSWEQVGMTLTGNANFGYDVDLNEDGTTAIVGIPYQNNSLGSEGAAMIYQLNEVTAEWEQHGSTLLGEDESDRLGYSVAISQDGNTVAVSLPGFDNPTVQVGKVRVFQLESGDWQQKGGDINTSGGYEFGWEIDLDNSGDQVAITSIGDVGGDVVYEWDGVDWIQKGQLFTEADDFSPFSVALSGDGTHVVFGSPNKFGLVEAPGSVYVYSWTGQTWSQVGDAITGDVLYNNFGTSVGTNNNGSRVAIGISRLRDGNNDDRGGVKVFEYIDNSWQQIGSTIFGEGEYDEFGTDVKLSADGNTLITGAIKNNNSGGGNAGHARIFDWNGTEWLQRGEDMDGQDFNEEFGQSVAISGDGQSVLVGSSMSNLVRYFRWNISTSILSLDKTSFTYGPNPTSGLLTISFEQAHEKMAMETYDMAGNLISFQEYNYPSTIELKLPEQGNIFCIRLISNQEPLAVIRVMKF